MQLGAAVPTAAHLSCDAYTLCLQVDQHTLAPPCCPPSLQVGMALDSRPLVTWELDVKFVSSANPLTDPTYAKGGQAELTQLQEELARLNCAMPLRQVGAGGSKSTRPAGLAAQRFGGLVPLGRLSGLAAQFVPSIPLLFVPIVCCSAQRQWCGGGLRCTGGTSTEATQTFSSSFPA